MSELPGGLTGRTTVETEPAAGDTPPGTGDRPAAAAPSSTPPAGDKAPKAKRKYPSGAAKRRGRKAPAAGAGASSRPSAGAALDAELRKLEQQLQALLVSPAIPMNMAGDEWAAAHVEQRGPQLAHQVIELARRNPAFRAQLQRAFAVTEGGQLAFAAVAYLVPLLIYYGLLPTPPIVKVQLGVPDRAAARVVIVEDYVPPVPSQDGPPHTFREQPPGTAGAPPSAAPGAASPG